MSNNSEKGRVGEHAITGIFSNMGVHERNFEVIRDSKTCEPENGVDLKLICPHNTSNKLADIIENGTSPMALSNAKIEVRVQVKNYSTAIGKATMQSFVDDSEKNPSFAEHWGVGGTRLTKGAEEILKEANKKVPTKWFTAGDIAKIQSQYPPKPFNQLNNNDDEK